MSKTFWSDSDAEGSISREGFVGDDGLVAVDPFFSRNRKGCGKKVTGCRVIT